MTTSVEIKNIGPRKVAITLIDPDWASRVKPHMDKIPLLHPAEVRTFNVHPGCSIVLREVDDSEPVTL